ncbi:hypothetical protein Kuja_0390 [Vibrio phage vB_VchM_Kuja]|uniref:Uncharacterized protein n=1 Tax=Vibrio phage vB_VchM_Kuja TaxID=2686437 RepID=A0A6B9J536_9CAUD|nr:hypothetical protein HWC83_gp039 [Vibrio phage vB_VchM_Kuja]QGZ16030.1 hypothetical protein Kuja_0390 [Vibrio phage vB_VchM_Kuja]
MNEFTIQEIAAISVAVLEKFGSGASLKDLKDLPEEHHSKKAEVITYKLNGETKSIKVINVAGNIYITPYRPQIIFS